MSESPSEKRHDVGTAEYGKLPALKTLKPKVEALIFKFHNFLDLSSERGHEIQSPVLCAHCHKWAFGYFSWWVQFLTSEEKALVLLPDVDWSAGQVHLYQSIFPYGNQKSSH